LSAVLGCAGIGVRIRIRVRRCCSGGGGGGTEGAAGIAQHIGYATLDGDSNLGSEQGAISTVRTLFPPPRLCPCVRVCVCMCVVMVVVWCGEVFWKLRLRRKRNETKNTLTATPGDVLCNFRINS